MINHPGSPGSAVILEAAADAFDPAQARAQIAELRKKADNLKTALVTSRRIGMAVGIVMRDQRCSADDAWAVLVKISQSTQRKLRDVAEGVIEHGTAR